MTRGSRRRWIRRIVAIVVMQAGVGLWLARGARATGVEALRGVVHDAKVLMLEEGRPSSVVEVNGLRLGLRAETRPSAIEDVYSEVERSCDVDFRSRSVDGSMLAPLGVGVLDEARRHGFVVCVEPRSEDWTWSDGLERFAERGDLVEIGYFRLHFVEGKGDETTVVSVEPHGPLRVFDAFPGDADVPGRDLEGLPRPKGSRRILSASIVGWDPRWVAYEMPSDVSQGWRRRYLDRLEHGGFRIGAAEVAGGRRTSVVWRRGTAFVIVAFDEVRGRAVVAMSAVSRGIAAG